MLIIFAPRIGADYNSSSLHVNGFNHSVRSIDEEDENGRSIADTLVDPMSVRPFEEILERHFANDD